MDKLEAGLNLMTKRQGRRWRLLFAGHSVKEIAKKEGVAQWSVYESLARGQQTAKKKIRKII